MTEQPAPLLQPDAATPPPPAGQWTPPGTPPTPPVTKPPSKTRTYIIGAIVLALVAIGGYVILQNENADDLVAGQCFDEPGSSVDITTVVKHACTEAHDAEVFQVVEYDEGDTYPISTTVDSFVSERCIPAFETYVGKPYNAATEFNVGYFYPDTTGWSRGDRTFTCYIDRADGSQMTQSVKGAAASE
jgi:hypothetical protein